MSTHSDDEVLDGRTDEPSRPQEEHKDAPPPKKSNGNGFLARIQHFTWANYTLPMSTGGLALLVSESTQPHTFAGLQTIGKVIYVFDLCLFALITATLLTRFVRYPGTLRASLRHPTEALFVPTFFLALASIIGGIGRYGIPSLGSAWLVVAYRVLFWVYFAATFGVAVGLYMVLFTSPRLRIEDMTPAWDLPIFPFMLCGTVAAIGASGENHQPPGQAMPMIVAGLTAQGLGMLVSLLMYACYLRRMVQFGLPSPHSRPAMFIAVGPPGFTAVALIGLAKDYPLHYGNYFGDDEVTAQVLKVVATMAGVFLWSLALWFFCLALLACLQTWRHMPFSLGWYAFVFPNVGFTMATINIGEALASPAAQWVGSAMTLLLVAAYLGVLACHARALARGELVAEGKDEDVYIDELRHAYGKVRFSDEEWRAESPKRD